MSNILHWRNAINLKRKYSIKFCGYMRTKHYGIASNVSSQNCPENIKLKCGRITMKLPSRTLTINANKILWIFHHVRGAVKYFTLHIFSIMFSLSRLGLRKVELSIPFCTYRHVAIKGMFPCNFLRYWF